MDTKRLVVKLLWFLFYPLLVVTSAFALVGIALLCWPVVWTEFDALERKWNERHNDPTDS